jgi:hypothetical protein
LELASHFFYLNLAPLIRPANDKHFGRFRRQNPKMIRGADDGAVGTITILKIKNYAADFVAFSGIPSIPKSPHAVILPPKAFSFLSLPIELFVI